jgi:hypothetical protein
VTAEHQCIVIAHRLAHSLVLRFFSLSARSNWSPRAVYSWQAALAWSRGRRSHSRTIFSPGRPQIKTATRVRMLARP